MPLSISPANPRERCVLRRPSLLVSSASCRYCRTLAQCISDLTVDLLLTDAVVDVFAERVDLAVRLGLLADSTLIAQQLMRTYYRVCASPNYLQRYGHPEHPSDIEAHNCLLFPTPWLSLQVDIQI